MVRFKIKYNYQTVQIDFQHLIIYTYITKHIINKEIPNHSSLTSWSIFTNDSYQPDGLRFQVGIKQIK